jgi:acyl-coenzyme A thioesterase PaaI-like protein
MSGLPDDGRSWTLVKGCGAYVDLVGLIYMTKDTLDPGEDVRFGFRVEAHHCNTRPVCHGGMLATFADISLARGLRVVRNVPAPLPTITMALDYLAPAPLGEWIDARVTVTRTGRGACFAQLLMYAAGKPILRASGIYKRFKLAVP